MNEREYQNRWTCVFDLENTQKDYATFLKMAVWIENNLHNSICATFPFQEDFVPFCISRAGKMDLSTRDALLALENRFSEKDSTKYSNITSASMLVDGLRKAGELHTFNYYLRVHINKNEIDIAELQYLVLILQALPAIQNRVAVRIMEADNAEWTTSDYFRVSDYLRFVQKRYQFFYSCYDNHTTSLQSLSSVTGGIQSTFLPVLEVDNRLCQLLNKSWKLVNNFNGQPYDKLHSALVPQGCAPGNMTWTLFQIGLRMLFASIPGRNFNSNAKKKELLSFLIELVQGSQGITPLDMLLFGALAGDKLKNKKDWNSAKAYMGNIQTFSLAISQILENTANHSEHNLGVFTFRLQRNTAYLNTRYPGYAHPENEPSLEVMIADSNNSDGIVDHFLKSSKADLSIKNNSAKICLEQLFGNFQDAKMEDLWKNARKKRPEMCHGLLSFFTSVQSFSGAVRVRSAPQFKSSTERDMFYYNGTQCLGASNCFLNSMYVPGTQFSIIVNQYASLWGSQSDQDWEFNFDTLVYATTYRELAQALRFNEKVHDLAVQEAITRTKRAVPSQPEKDAVVLEWKNWFDEQCKKAYETKHEVFCCDLEGFGKQLTEDPTLGEPFCKGFLSSRFFRQDKPEKDKVYYAVLFQNPSAQFSRIFSGTLQVMARQEELDLSHISVYFYPKQYKGDYLPYCATTLHQLLGQTVNEDEFPKIFPYTLFLKSASGHSLFEDELYKQANSSIYKSGQGFKLPETHMRLGNKVHLDTFYEMALFFENPNYAYYTAFLLLRTLLNNYSCLLRSKKHLLLYGYASYSRAIVWALHQILEEYWKMEAEHIVPETEFVIYQNNLKLESEQPQIQMYYSRSEWQQDPSKVWEPEDTVLVMIVPISSSLTTFNKMKAELDRETKKRFPTEVNFTAFWVRDCFTDEHKPSSAEEYFWQLCDPVEKTIESRLVAGKIYYLRYAISKWSDPLNCRRCFPDDALQEYPLVETDPTSTIPTQQFYLEPPHSDPLAADAWTENDKRIARLKGHILYGHISKGSNHYQYFVKPRTYFLQEKERIAQWLAQLREETLKSDPNISAPNRVNILIIPQQIDNVEFGQYVYEYFFHAHAECVVINTEKEFRSNLQAEYSGLFQRLRAVMHNSEATVRFYFIDNSVCSGNSFNRAMSLLSSCTRTQDVKPDGSFNVSEFRIEKVFLLVSRLSDASKRMYVKDPSRDFHAYAELHISAMRTFGDSCIPCKVQKEAQQYYKKAATKAISAYWEKKSYIRKCISFDQFEMPAMTEAEQSKKDLQQAEGFRRMICSHRAASYIRPVQGKEKSDYFSAVRGFLEELRSLGTAKQTEDTSLYCSLDNTNKIEWISAGLKILARPFFTFDYRLRCVVMDLFLLLSEFLIKESSLDVVKKRLEKPEKGYIKSYLLENEHLLWCKSFADDLSTTIGDDLFQQLVFIRDHILKGLADIRSNYILRQDTMLQISRRLSEAAVSCGLSANDVTEFYDHYLRSILRITHSSSDETKGVWLEHLLQYGQEHPGKADGRADGINQLVAQVPENVQTQFRDFLELLLVENNRPIYQAVVEFKKYREDEQSQEMSENDIKVGAFLDKYHMRNAKTFLSYGDNTGTEQQLNALIDLLQPGRSQKSYRHRYQSLGEDLSSIVRTETGTENDVVLFGRNAESQSPAAEYLNLSDYFTLFPSHLRKKNGPQKGLEQTVFEAQWEQIKNSKEIKADLDKNGFSLMPDDESQDAFNIIIKLDNNYDEIVKSQEEDQYIKLAVQKQEISIQKIDPIFIYIPCILPRQRALVLTRKILMFRCKLIEWLEKDFNNNAIAVLSQQQHIAKLLSTDKMGDHAEIGFVECQQQLLLATDQVEFDEELRTKNWEYAADAVGRRANLYDVPKGVKPPLCGYLEKAQEWFFLRSYINARIARLFRTMVRTANEMDGERIIDAESYYARDEQSVLMRPVCDLKTVFFTPIRPGYIRKRYIKQMLEVVTFEIDGKKDYGENNSAGISERMGNLSRQFSNFRCIHLQSDKTGEEYAYLSEYLSAILLDCFISAVKAGKIWNQEGWGGDAYCELAKKDAGEKCRIEVFRESGGSFGGYNYDYLVVRNDIHHTLRSEKKGPGMSQAAIKWYVEGLWRSCLDSKGTYPKVIANDDGKGKYLIKLPILKHEEA